MKIIKLYLKYQITLSNLIIFSVLILVLDISYLINITNFNDNLSYEEIIDFYFQNSFYYTKIIIVFISCFLFMKSKNERNEYLINIVITAGYNKKDNYKGQIICNLIILFIIISILFLSFLMIGTISKKYFEMDIKYIVSYLNLIILSFHHGLVTYFLILITNNQMTYILVLLLFIFTDLIANYNSDLKYFSLCCFPNINNQTGLFHINVIYVLIFIVLLNIINEYVYTNMDLKS